MSRKEIHIAIPERLMQRFEESLDMEGLTKTNFLVAKIQEFCEKVEEKQFMRARQTSVADEAKIEHALAQARASLAIEGLDVTPEGEELVRKSVRGEISRAEFLQKALEIANRE
jgi:hypothetical protein